MEEGRILKKYSREKKKKRREILREEEKSAFMHTEKGV